MLNALPKARRVATLCAAAALCFAATASTAQIRAGDQVPVPQGEIAAGAQPWRALGAMPANVMAGEPWIRPERYGSFALDAAAMRAALALAPLEAGRAEAEAAAVIEIPLPDGTLGLFSCVESPTLGPELQAQHPNIRTYAVWSVHDRSVSGRIDLTPLGFHAIIATSEGTIFVDPVTRNDFVHHVSYFRDDFRTDKQFRCLVDDAQHAIEDHAHGAAHRGDTEATGNAVRTYRLALACTGEYAAFFGNTVEGVLASTTTTINRVNFVYIRELAVSLTYTFIVPFFDPNTDPYTDGDPVAMLGQNQTTLDSLVGSANYDIGHLVSINGGGLAGVGVVCNASNKARAVTGSTTPVGDPFDIDYVAHEIGHQFSARHTFNSSAGACSGNRASTSAYEPGSGSTVMGYAGICGTDNLQPNTDAYFHAHSHAQIQAFIAGSGGGCATLNNSVNNGISTVNAGPDYIVPARTQFTLKATGFDPDGDSLTYSWEQFDLGPTTPVAAPDAGQGPIFRSLTANSSGQRTFPQTNFVGGSTTIVGDRFPLTSRTMNFRATVRDNWVLAGSVNSDDMTVTTVNTGAPFRLTSPNTGGSFLAGQQVTLTWDVAGSNLPPIGTIQVLVSYSTDGGQTYPWTSGIVDNAGFASVTLPDFPTDSNVRIKIEAVGNIFFDVADQEIFVLARIPVPTNVVASASPICAGSSATLSASVADGLVIDWFADACGGAFITTSSSVQVSPTSARIYFARARSLIDGRVSDCVPVTVAVDQPPLVDNSISVDRDGYCAGDAGTITLEAFGGVGSTVTWFEFPSFAILGTGNPITLPSPERSVVYVAGRSNSCGQAVFGVTTNLTVNAADIDRDGEISFGDFLAFFNCYDIEDPCADLDENPGVDFGDFLSFFNGYDSGC
jgi:hypothetical protein